MESRVIKGCDDIVLVSEAPQCSTSSKIKDQEVWSLRQIVSDLRVFLKNLVRFVAFAKSINLKGTCGMCYESKGGKSSESKWKMSFSIISLDKFFILRLKCKQRLLHPPELPLLLLKRYIIFTFQTEYVFVQSPPQRLPHYDDHSEFQAALLPLSLST